MNEMQIFNNPEFGEIRTVTIDGEPWFVGVDIAKALGYKKPTDAVSNNVDGDDSTREGITDNLGRTQQAIVVNESGMYSLIFGSKLESAKKFKKWVTSEVLPSIRKTGYYGKNKLPQNPMQLLELHYEAIKHVDKKVDGVSEKVDSLTMEFNQFKCDLPILGVEEDRITNAVKKKGLSVMGGKSSNAYHDRSIVNAVYKDIYMQIYRNFGVKSYKAIKRSQCDNVLEIVEKYEPTVILGDRIKYANAQVTMNI